MNGSHYNGGEKQPYDPLFWEFGPVVLVSIALLGNLPAPVRVGSWSMLGGLLCGLKQRAGAVGACSLIWTWAACVRLPGVQILVGIGELEGSAIRAGIGTLQSELF